MTSFPPLAGRGKDACHIKMEVSMRLALAKWLLRGSRYHIHTNPGQHPKTRKALNEAVSKNLDKLALQGFEDYEERKENAKV